MDFSINNTFCLKTSYCGLLSKIWFRDDVISIASNITSPVNLGLFQGCLLNSAISFKLQITVPFLMTFIGKLDDSELDKIILKDFFTNYKNNENKITVVDGFGDYDDAINVIKESKNAFLEKKLVG